MPRVEFDQPNPTIRSTEVLRLSADWAPVADFGRQSASGRIRSAESNNSVDRSFAAVHRLGSGYGFRMAENCQPDSIDRI